MGLPAICVGTKWTLVPSILDSAAEESLEKDGFPQGLISIVECGEDIAPMLRKHDQPQLPMQL